MKNYLTFLAYLLLFGKIHAEEILEVDMAFDDHSVLVSLSTHMITAIPTNTISSTESSMSTIQPATSASNESSIQISPFTTIPTLTVSNVINVTTTVKETIKVYVPAETASITDLNESRKPKKRSKKIKRKQKRRKHQRKHQKKPQQTKHMTQTTEIIEIKQRPPTVAVQLTNLVNEDKDISDIWNYLEENSNPKQKIKKNKVQEQSESEEDIYSEEEHNIKEEERNKSACKTKARKEKKEKVQSKTKKFHTLPAKKKKGSCLMQQTVLIPDDHIKGPTILPPIASKLLPTATDKRKVVYNCITNYAGTATTTVTKMTIVPVPQTDLRIRTHTVVAPTTKILTEIHYTPYTVTKTSTDTMFMIKVTTANGGCRACELDSNGMVLPANQLPPGIFATPVGEVDRSKFDIIGYAGMNPTNFNPQMQGFQPTRAAV